MVRSFLYFHAVFDAHALLGFLFPLALAAAPVKHTARALCAHAVRRHSSQAEAPKAFEPETP